MLQNSKVTAALLGGDLDKTIKVFMTTINMSAYKKPNMLVDGMKITVNGIPSEYGMPSFTDESGNLYSGFQMTEQLLR